MPLYLESRIPTSRFTILESQNPRIDESYEVQERHCEKICERDRRDTA